MSDEELTMVQAAEFAGYTSPTFLHKAARAGRLRTTRHERSGVRMTTRAWLQAFLAGRDMRASSTRRTPPEEQEGHEEEGACGGATGERTTEWLTVPTAAKRAGYATASTLYAAAKAGRLRTRTEGVGPYLTTQDWVDEFLAGLCCNTEARGQPAASRRGGARLLPDQEGV